MDTNYLTHGSLGPEMDTLVKKYVEQLNPKELKALRIAQEQLESSFEIEKSLGFLVYLKTTSASNEVDKG